MQRNLLQAGRHLRNTVGRRTSSSSSGVSKVASQRFRQTAEYFLVSTAALAGGAFITWQLTEGKRKIALDAVKSQPGIQSTRDVLRQWPEADVDIQSARRSPAQEVEDIPTTSGSRSAPKPPPRSREPSASSQVDIDVQGAEAEGDATEGITVTGEGEEDEGAGGAFNPITGEINWDCPCLGGMAHGPCGQQFRDAFSCFVYSQDEPKGIDCVDRFQLMQDCFREHPDIYAEEISDDETSRDVEAEVDRAAPSIPENHPSDDTPQS